MSNFEVIYGYKLRRLLYLLPLSSHARVSKSVESFASKV